MAANVHVLRDIVRDFVYMVDIAYDNLATSNELYEYIPETKSNSASREFLDEAYAKITRGDSLMALELLSRAIAAGENSTDELPKFYAHRARFLKEANYAQEAGEDIQRALKCFIEHEETESFIRSLQDPSQNTSRDDRPVPTRKPPHIPFYEVNQLFPCSTRNIKIVNGETKGKRVIATSRLFISENIVTEKPLVITPGRNVSLSFCHECMEFSVNPVPCSNCRKVAFCGEVCKETAWVRYHKYECKIQYIIEKNLNYQYRLAVKIALSFHDYIDPREDNLHCPEEYKDILMAEIDLHEISDQTINDFASFAAQIFHGLKENTTFFKDIRYLFKFDVFKGLLMKFMLIVDAYKHDTIRSYLYYCNERLESFTISCIGIYPFSRNFRIGCSPNVSLNFCESTMVIKPLRVIKPGEELFIPGGHNYAVTPKEERQAIFQEKYSTTCKCEACENNWPFVRDLDRRHDSGIIFNLHLITMALEITSPLDVYTEHSHALAKEYIGIFLVGPSLEWFAWQTLLLKLHQRLCSHCDAVLDFLGKVAASRVSVEHQ